MGIKFPNDLWNDPTHASEKDWLIEAKWRFSDESDWTAIDATIVARASEKKATITVAGPDHRRKEADKTRPIDVKIRYRYDSGSTEGISLYNGIWLASSFMNEGPAGAESMNKTTIHEIGHFIGMVAVGQSTFYIDHDHDGEHCSTGLSVEELEKASCEGLDGTCTMFGESSDSQVLKFCALCFRAIPRDIMSSPPWETSSPTWSPSRW